VFEKSKKTCALSVDGSATKEYVSSFRPYAILGQSGAQPSIRESLHVVIISLNRTSILKIASMFPGSQLVDS